MHDSNTFHIRPVLTEADLQSLMPLLTLSFGSEVDWQDELDYFRSLETYDCLMLIDKHKPVGFVREFTVTDTLAQGEWMVLPKYRDYESFLIENYLRTRQSKVEFRLCILASQKYLYESLLTLGFRKQENFLHYETDSQTLAQLHADVTWAHTGDLERVQAALNHFGNLTALQLLSKIQEQKIIGVRNTKGLLCGAAYLKGSSPDWEIVQLAICSDSRQQGHGLKLMQGLFALLRAQDMSARVHLKVKSTNVEAIALYERAEMNLIPQREEIWLYYDSN